MNRKGEVSTSMDTDMIVYWILGLIVFALVVVGVYLVLSGKATSALESIKNIFKFGA